VKKWIGKYWNPHCQEQQEIYFLAKDKREAELLLCHYLNKSFNNCRMTDEEEMLRYFLSSDDWVKEYTGEPTFVTKHELLKGYSGFWDILKD
jgi:hypothetical protein